MKPMGAFPPEFARQHGPLAIGGRSAADWVAQAGDTPLFVYDSAIVAARIARFRAAMPAIDLHYAIKANPHGDLLAAIAPLVGDQLCRAGQARRRTGGGDPRGGDAQR